MIQKEAFSLAEIPHKCQSSRMCLKGAGLTIDSKSTIIQCRNRAAKHGQTTYKERAVAQKPVVSFVARVSMPEPLVRFLIQNAQQREDGNFKCILGSYETVALYERRKEACQAAMAGDPEGWVKTFSMTCRVKVMRVDEGRKLAINLITPEPQEKPTHRLKADRFYEPKKGATWSQVVRVDEHGFIRFSLEKLSEEELAEVVAAKPDESKARAPNKTSAVKPASIQDTAQKKKVHKVSPCASSQAKSSNPGLRVVRYPVGHRSGSGYSNERPECSTVEVVEHFDDLGRRAVSFNRK